jgi:hypothetical protein
VFSSAKFLRFCTLSSEYEKYKNLNMKWVAETARNYYTKVVKRFPSQSLDMFENQPISVMN